MTAQGYFNLEVNYSFVTIILVLAITLSKKTRCIPVCWHYNIGWAVSRAPRNYVECDVKQCKINGVEYLFLSFDV